MRRYSVFALAREALRGHSGWQRAWADAAPKAELRGRDRRGRGPWPRNCLLSCEESRYPRRRGTGEGMARRGQYRAEHHDHPLELPAAADRRRSTRRRASLYETLSQELNFNVMFSPRGVLMLAQTEHELARLEADGACQPARRDRERAGGPGADPARSCRSLNFDGPRYPVLGGLWQPRGGTARHDAVAWGYARAASAMGVDVIQNCEVLGIDRDAERRDRRSDHARGDRYEKALPRGRGVFGGAGGAGGVPAADRERRAAGAGLRADQAGARLRGDGQYRARLHLAVRQGRDGDRRRCGRLQQLHPARQLPSHRGDAASADRDDAGARRG